MGEGHTVGMDKRWLIRVIAIGTRRDTIPNLTLWKDDRLGTDHVGTLVTTSPRLSHGIPFPLCSGLPEREHRLSHAVSLLVLLE